VCTLIIGNGTLAPGSIVIAANRDENPARASDPPGVLRERPRVVGGRDRVMGGTWLAIRERRAAVAMLNRREEHEPDPDSVALRRSRGLLALEVAAAEDGGAVDAAQFALAQMEGWAHAPFSMLFASPGGCWLLVYDGDVTTEMRRVPPGWHALTHSVLDDPGEPRAAWLAARLRSFAPRTTDEAERGLFELLRSHGDEAGAPPVCLHQGSMVTVSSSLVFLGPDRARYLHNEGRPCQHPPLDRSGLLSGATAVTEPA